MSVKKKKNHPWEGFADNPLAYEYGGATKDNVKKGKQKEIDQAPEKVPDLDNADTEALPVSVEENVLRNSKGKEDIQVEERVEPEVPAMPVNPAPAADLKKAATDLRNAKMEIGIYFAAAKTSLDIAAEQSKKDPIKMGIVKRLGNIFSVLNREPRKAKVVINDVDQLQGSVKKSDAFFEKKKENKLYKNLSSLFTNIRNAAGAVLKVYEADGVFSKLSGNKSKLSPLINPVAVMEMMEEIRPVAKAHSAPATMGTREPLDGVKKAPIISTPILNRSGTGSLFGGKPSANSMHPIERIGVILFDFKSDERAPMLKMTLLMDLKEQLKKEGGHSKLVYDMCDKLCTVLGKLRVDEFSNSGGRVYKHTDKYVIGEIQAVVDSLDESSKKAVMSTKAYKNYAEGSTKIAQEAGANPPKLK